MTRPALDSNLDLDLTEVERHLDAGMTFPVAWYTDPGIYRLEFEAFHRNSWQAICFSRRVAGPGDHAVGTVGDVPIVIVRGEDMVLRGFINVCRHRAFPLATCDGSRKTLQCAYHAWTYDLDGRLRAAPRSDHEPGFDKDAFGLLPVAVEEVAGFAWAHPNPDAPPLAEEHPTLHALADEWDFDTEPYTIERGRHHFDVAANWKVFVENGSECYHCDTVHKDSFGDAFDVSPEEYLYVNRDRLIGQHAKPNPRAKRFTGGKGHYRYVFVWPCTMLEFDDVLASVLTVRPTGPESCRVEYETWAHRDADPATIEAWDDLYLRTNTEDVEVVALQQPNLTANAVPYGRLMPNAESAIAHFHRIVFEEVRAAIS